MARDENRIDDLGIDELVGDDSEGRSRFSSAKLGRFAAVAFFLLLGTVSVVHTMNRRLSTSDSSDHADAEHPIAASEAKDTPPRALGSIGRQVAASLIKTQSATKPTSPMVDPTKIRVANQLAPPTKEPSGTAFTRSSTPSVKRSQNGPKVTGLKPPTGSNRFGPPAAQKQDQPVARLAQAPGRPLLPSTRGFRELDRNKPADNNGFTTPKPNTTTGSRFPALPQQLKPQTAPKLPNRFGDTTRPGADLVKKSGADAQKLLGDLAGRAENLRNQTAATVGAAGRTLENLSARGGNSTKRSPRLQNTTSPPAGSRFGTGSNSAKPADRFAPPTRQPRVIAQPTSGSGNRSKNLTTQPQRPSSITPAAGRRPAANDTPVTRLPARPISTSGNRTTRGISRSAEPSTGGFNRSTGPVSRTARMITSNLPGERNLDGMQAPSLTIEKFSPREVQVYQPADFQIVIRNVGRVPVDNVQVFDQIPVGADFLEASPKPTTTADRQLSWNIGSIEPGTEKRIEMKLKPTKPGEIGSVAQMTFATRSSMRTKVTQPRLEITHRTRPQVMIGDNVIFDVLVTNRGDGPARNVMIQEDIPNQLDFRDGHREIEYEVGTLLPNQSRNVRLALKAMKPGNLKNVIHATGGGGLKSQHQLDLEIVSPQLKAKADGPTRRFMGRRAQHQFSVSNQGTAAATNVELIARLPRGLRYVNSNNKGTYDASSHAILWELAELQQGVNADVEIMTEPIAVGSQPIKFEVNADLGLTDAVQQPLSVEHLVDVFFDIDDVVDPIEIGSETHYRVQVVNQGTKAATNVRLQIDFPNGLKPTSVDGPLENKINGQQILFSPIESLKPGQRVQFLVNGAGQAAGDHRVVLKMQTDGRSTAVAKEESTRVYSDR